jgi:hypothetical protein
VTAFVIHASDSFVADAQLEKLFDKGFARQVIEVFGQQWLGGRFASPQCVYPYASERQLHFDTHVAMHPVPIGLPAVTQAGDPSVLIGAADVDHRSPKRPTSVEAEVFRHRPTGRGGVDAGRGAGPQRLDKTGRAFFELIQIGVMKTTPDLTLPAAVEGLDLSLEPLLTWRGEDRDHAELQAQADNASEAVGPLMGSLEDQVVVELGIGGKAMMPPVIKQRLDHGFGGDCRFRPALGQSAMQAHGIEHGYLPAALDDQIGDGVEAVEFDLACGEPGEEPSPGRRRAANASACIQQSVALKDASDGAHAGTGLNAAFQKHAVDGSGAMLAQDAFVFEITANRQHAPFEAGCNAVDGPARSRGSVGKVDPIKPAAFGAADPELDGSMREAKTACDLAQWTAAAHRQNHGPAALLDGPLFDSWVNLKLSILKRQVYDESCHLHV